MNGIYGACLYPCKVIYIVMQYYSFNSVSARSLVYNTLLFIEALV